MNKKEILEIRKQFTPEDCTISRICGCYVDGEKHIVMEHKDAFGSLSEEEAFKYFDIFRHTLSGTPGKNLMDMEFPLETEAPGGTQDFLLRLRDSHLEDDLLLEEFYQKVIESYSYDMNYYIILIHAVYDIPGKSSDNLEMFDASDNVYDFILCSICPVNLSKAGLYYNTEKNAIEDRIRDWIVASPANGFLFPAFNDRNTDIHGILYYTKNAENMNQNLVDQLLGCVPPLSASSQKETFHSVMESALGEDCGYELVRNLHEDLGEMLEAAKDSPEPLTLTKRDVRCILEENDIPEEKIQAFEKEFDESISRDTPVLVSNIVNTRQFQIETPDVVIKVKPERMDLVETKVIDGRTCLVIPVDEHIEVNGMTVSTIKPEEGMD
ncbi:MAG TPA: DUF4317 domain-containing protein [Candidatus Ruminococcus avistercoris]|nr:DUF4317 domain-containing protein [Candidatus Ruminococcus avistercoris]